MIKLNHESNIYCSSPSPKLSMDSLTPWSSMATDCLAEIFSKLGPDDLTVAIPFVCKSWLAAVLHPLCWQKLDFRKLDVLPWSSFSKSFKSRYYLPYFSFSSLLKLAVKNSCNSVTELRLPLKSTCPEDLKFISDECPKLKSLALPILCSEDEVLISELVCKWSDLERLELKFSPLNLPQLLKKISLHCKKFSELIVTGEIREADAMAIVSYLPKIKSLNLSGSYLPKKELLVVVKGCKELQELTVNGCIGFEEDDSKIKAEVSGIRNFESKGCRLFVEEDCECGDWRNDFCLDGYVF